MACHFFHGSKDNHLRPLPLPDNGIHFSVPDLFHLFGNGRALLNTVTKHALVFAAPCSMPFEPQRAGEIEQTERELLPPHHVVQHLRARDLFQREQSQPERERGVRVIGDYRMRWNSFTGKVKPSEARVTTQAHVGTAYKNYLEKAEHGFEQRLRAGVDARVGKNTNIKILGSASGNAGVDTEVDASKNRGLSHARIDKADVTQHIGKWDLSLGRLTEPMGVTGYWFGKEYDGARRLDGKGNAGTARLRDVPPQYGRQ